MALAWACTVGGTVGRGRAASRSVSISAARSSTHSHSPGSRRRAPPPTENPACRPPRRSGRAGGAPPRSQVEGAGLAAGPTGPLAGVAKATDEQGQEAIVGRARVWAACISTLWMPRVDAAGFLGQGPQPTGPRSEEVRGYRHSPPRLASRRVWPAERERARHRARAASAECGEAAARLLGQRRLGGALGTEAGRGIGTTGWGWGGAATGRRSSVTSTATKAPTTAAMTSEPMRAPRLVTTMPAGSGGT